MDTIKISAASGRYTIVCDRASDVASQHSGIIKAISSTELSPFAAINFDLNGPVGGMYISADRKDLLIAKAKDAGMQISNI